MIIVYQKLLVENHILQPPEMNGFPIGGCMHACIKLIINLMIASLTLHPNANPLSYFGKLIWLNTQDSELKLN